jgi:pyruvate dehydrogenase E2 component (dihydrolipoamide acetyltransferase)
VAVAVALESGLITPIIRNADQKSIIDISNEMKALAKRARETGLRPEEFQGGGFSISNLGMYGIKQFQAIVNPPQSCIMAVGASNKRPIVINDQISVANIMDISLSCDHRVVDGAVGAKFLASFKKFIEHPIKMVI